MEAGHNQPIIINKKIKKGGGHGHHGGAWKVAYADFVTAMMAFFLLLWLLSSTTVEQRAGIGDYFTPTTSFRPGASGAGGILGGQTLSDSGAKIGEGGTPSVVVELTPPSGRDAKEKDIEELAAKREQESFEEAVQALNKAITDSPELSDLQENIQVDMTPEGMRIQIVDREGGSLFRAGSAEMTARTRDLLEQIAQVVATLPNDISISGHTDSSPFSRGDYSNWELSSDRANASRRLLVTSGIDSSRIVQVVGKADQEPLIEEDPFLPENRRVSIVLRRTAAVLPPGLFD
ncbi:MAG: flagellar motor protein MotB [Alphaproteobacteria bacterium]|nr:flagellar motor protein MotB [Alphaproteobacteria bacterium]